MTATAPPRPDVVGDPDRGGATSVQALNAALRAELAADERVVLLGEDIGATGGVFRVTAGLQDEFGGERVWDTPICESGFVGAAVGMALAGDRPVVELQFDSFAYPALEQIISHVGRYRWRTGGACAMPMVLRIPYGGGTHAPELHSESPETLFCHMPGLRVVTPATPQDAYTLLRWAVRCDDPVVFLEPKRRYRDARAPVDPDLLLTPAEEVTPVLRREGADVTLVTYGSMLGDCLDAASALAEEGIEAGVLDLRSLSPLDEDTLLEHVTATGRAVVVHEAPRSVGVGAEVAAVLAERALLHLEAPVTRVTGLDAPFPMFVHEFEYLPSPERIAAAARETVAF